MSESRLVSLLAQSRAHACCSATRSERNIISGVRGVVVRAAIDQYVTAVRCSHQRNLSAISTLIMLRSKASARHARTEHTSLCGVRDVRLVLVVQPLQLLHGLDSSPLFSQNQTVSDQVLSDQHCEPYSHAVQLRCLIMPVRRGPRDPAGNPRTRLLQL